MGEYSRHVMEAAILLVLSNLFIFSNSGPDPEINLHVHLPPEEVPHVPDIGGAKVKNTTKGVKTIKGDNDTEEALEVHHPDTEAASGPTEAPKGITSPPMKSKVVKEEKDKKTNDTISFEMEGEMDDQPYVSCGATMSTHVKIAYPVQIALLQHPPGCGAMGTVSGGTDNVLGSRTKSKSIVGGTVLIVAQIVRRPEGGIGIGATATVRWIAEQKPAAAALLANGLACEKATP